MHKLSLTGALFLFVMVLAGAVQAAVLPDFKPIVKSNTPAVVKILVEYGARGRPEGHPEIDSQEIPEALRRFFEYRGAPPPQRPSQSMGSGFIISRDGYIVTNNHVVAGADEILVRMTDRREFEAEVVGLDPRSDLALLKVEAKNLPVLKLGEPGELEVGEWVLAIGSPFGLDYSVTAGIVSAKGRSLPTRSNDNYVPFIQTDVAINPGNSGGPLFNLDGEVVGVNSQIFTRSGGSIGLSFAIPVSVVVDVVDQLKESGEVTRGWLGVTIQDVDKNLAESFGLDKPMGALVTQLQPGGPAAEGGLQAGDIIIKFDGADIATSTELPHVVGLVRPGTRAELVVMRDRKRKTMSLEVGGLSSGETASMTAGEVRTSSGGRLGLAVEDLDEQARSRWGISGGVVVTEVVPGEIAAEAGIRPGDVITLVGSTAISSMSAYEKAMGGLESGESVPLRIIRRGTPLFIGVRIP
jgi:serine protease Do